MSTVVVMTQKSEYISESDLGPGALNRHLFGMGTQIFLHQIFIFPLVLCQSRIDDKCQIGITLILRDSNFNFKCQP